jgi:PGF-pre-PGF domain-containing protein
MSKIKNALITLMLILAVLSIVTANAVGNNFEENNRSSVSNPDFSEQTFDERMETLKNMKKMMGERKSGSIRNDALPAVADYASASDSVQISDYVSLSSSGGSGYSFTLEGDANLLWSYEVADKDEVVIIDFLDDVNKDGVVDVLLYDNNEKKLYLLSGINAAVIWEQSYDVRSLGVLYKDLNLDGISEAVIASLNYDINTGQGTVTVSVLNGANGQVLNDCSYSIETDLAATEWYLDMKHLYYESSDLTGDSISDIIIHINSDYELDVDEHYSENHHETFLVAINPATCTVIWDIVIPEYAWEDVFDFDCTGDGINDLLVEFNSGFYLLSGVNGMPVINYSSDDRLYLECSEKTDVDGDGLPDILIGISNDTVHDSVLNHIYENRIIALKGTNGVQLWEVPCAHTQSTNFDFNPLGGDINCDGIEDIVTGIRISEYDYINYTTVYKNRVALLSGADGSELWTTPFYDTVNIAISTTYVNDDLIPDVCLVIYSDSWDDWSIVEVQTLNGLNGNLMWEHTGKFNSVDFSECDINGDNKDEVFLISAVPVSSTDYTVYLRALSSSDGSQLWENSYPFHIDFLLPEGKELNINGWTWCNSDLNGDSISDPLMVIDFYYFNSTTVEPTYYESEMFLAADGSDGRALWNAQYFSDNRAWIQLIGIFDLNKDGTNDIFLGNAKGAYAIATTLSTAGQAPVASFYANITSGEAPLGVQFTDTSSRGPTSWLWNFGDGTTSTAMDPVHTYSAAGDYTVSLTVSNNHGSDSMTKTSYIHVRETNIIPTATIISVSPNPARSGNSIELIGTGTDTDGSIVAYEWTSSIEGYLGNSATLSTSSLSVGNHTISFRVQDNAGAWSDTVSVDLHILDNAIPTASIVLIDPGIAVVDNMIAFSGEGNDIDGTVEGYNWRSSIDGQLSTEASFSMSTLTAGTHTIYFKVQDNDGTWSPEVTLNLIVDDGAPYVSIVAGFTDSISINNPVEIKLNSSDMYPGTTEFVIRDSANALILLKNVTGILASGEHTFMWNATDGSGEPLPSGMYTLNLSSTDAFGHLSMATVSVTVDNTAPSIDVNDISGTSTRGNVVYANSVLLVNVSASGTPGDATSVELILSSAFSSFRTNIDANLENGFWLGTFDLSLIPDDGNYIITIVSEDAAKNSNSIVSDLVVTIDRVPPGMSSTVTKINQTHAYVNITSTESLQGEPEVTVSGATVAVELAGSRWSGIFEHTDSGTYIVNVNGLDLAGNTGTSVATAHIASVEISDGTGSFSDPDSGIMINFTTVGSFTDTIVVSESTSSFMKLSGGRIGLCFMDVQLGTNLAGNLSNATIAIKVNTSLLPAGMVADDVVICYYNESTGIWEELVTTVQNIGGSDYWVTQVEHFSTYAAIAIDSIAPVLESVTPSEGYSFAEGPTSVSVRFNYSDAQTGVNVSAVIIKFDDVDVTGSAHTKVTGSYASYSASGLAAGSHSASVYVMDYAGNAQTFTTRFTIGSSASSGGGSGSGGSSGGGGGGGTTGEKYENIQVKEVLSIFVSADSRINYEFKEKGNAITYIQFNSLKNSGKIQAIVEVLKSRSSFAKTDAPGKMYKHMNIWVGKAGFVTSDNVEDLLIGFKVEKSWLKNNNIQASEVRLYRYSDDMWDALTTSIIGEDDEHVYFESRTPGFSPFAISSEASTEMIDASLRSPEDAGTDLIEGEGGQAASTTESKSYGILPVFGGVLVILIAAYVLYRKRS